MNIRKTRFARVTSVVTMILAGFYLALNPDATRATEFEPSGEPARAVVRYADLNLSSREGVQQLYQRIVASADAVCGKVDPRDLAVWSRFRICTDHSVARAVAAIGHPGLSAFHQQRNGAKIRRYALVMRDSAAP